MTLDRYSLWDLTAASGLPADRFVADASGSIRLAALAAGSSLGATAEPFRGRSVLISSARQLPTVIALLRLDGVARRIVLCPPDLSSAQLPFVIDQAQVDVVISEGTEATGLGLPNARLEACFATRVPTEQVSDRGFDTEWLLFTSGTTGRPKIVSHTLRTLTNPLHDGLRVSHDTVWSTFYDVRRYGGLQVLLRALVGGGCIVLSLAGESVADFIARAGSGGVTHISGTPSHWRQALMSGATKRMSPWYIRVSGEPADQGILDRLTAAFPRASIAHAFASTEAGVAFDVRDGKAGFPATFIGQAGRNVELRIFDGSLRIRSPSMASHYVGGDEQLVDAEGFVDTRDMLELRDGRYYFVGRREGVINVGGEKVYPEEIEAVINQHPSVQMARVRGRPNPITGALVVADLVMRCPAALQAMQSEILDFCRRALPPHKVPAMLREVPSLETAVSGKVLRSRA